ncbi:MAG: type II toxin-antitoxin system RelE/ParE family toxin [Cyclobacteriaceae bacterium]|nr:type II toxin-antitoxin system RelE/ParE family toxin [Cyclobacteriaceae bacterium]
MPLKYLLSREAEDDLLDAYDWYEQQRVGLGEEFLESMESARETILKNPETYRIRYKKRIRAFLVNRFPYLILYILENETVNVVAIFHTSRNPRILIKRFGK